MPTRFLYVFSMRIIDFQLIRCYYVENLYFANFETSWKIRNIINKIINMGKQLHRFMVDVVSLSINWTIYSHSVNNESCWNIYANFLHEIGFIGALFLVREVKLLKMAGRYLDFGRLHWSQVAINMIIFVIWGILETQHVRGVKIKSLQCSTTIY